VRRLRVQQLTVLLACSPYWCWRGAGRVLGARDAARTSASLQSTVDRVDELRRAATRLSRDLVTMETSRRAYLVTGDAAARRAHLRAGARADRGVRRVRRLSRPWVDLSPLADRVARRYQAWVRSGRDELAARRDGARAAAADRRFQALWSGQVVGMADLDEVAGAFPALADLVARMGVRSLALVPLRSRGRFLGLLALCWTERHRLDREQEALLGLAGNQIAGALEAALRLEEAERAAGEARAVFYASPTGCC
jgi:GAF domain-containing protein